MMRKGILLKSGVVALVVLLVATAAVAGGCKKTEEEAPPVEEVVEPEPEPEVWFFPLTGLETTEESLIYNRPLSVKIENSPEARPQLGITGADVVYETITEGGITRFNCIFQSTVPEEVGPVRSGRDSDVTIVPQYDGLFFFSGANDIVLGEIAAARLADMSHNAASSLYHRVSYRQAPHNLYLDLPAAYGLAQEKGFEVTLDAPRALEFGPSEHAGAVGATEVTVPFSSGFTATWTWNDAEEVYLRAMGGQSVDADGDKPVGAANVVVLWAEYVAAAKLPTGGQTYNVNLNGSGKASVFFGGKRIDGTWESDGANPPRFKDESGKAIQLTPGKTWFQVLNNGTEITATGPVAEAEAGAEAGAAGTAAGTTGTATGTAAAAEDTD